MSQYLITLFVLFPMICISAQNTMGTIFNTAESLQGYTFFSPFSGTDAWMVDNCGRLINRWDRDTRPGLSAYFLPTGHMLRTYKPDPEGPFTSASNAGGIEIVDWNNNTVWYHEINTPSQISHHDAVYLPNGNILILTWELVFTEELIESGRNPDEIAPQGFMWSERILELHPVGTDSASIIWEWQIKDHYIQDFDPSKANFGVVANHPELFDINLPELNSNNSNASRDWNHFNAIDYNATLDQILISVRNSDEIWILDHSTTTEEAAGHTGGNSKMGGDILYRWGNPAAYRRGAVSDQQLFGQHGTVWIPDSLSDGGSILIFDNGNGRPGPDFSRVLVLTPPTDSVGRYLIEPDLPFGPESPDWVYGDQQGESFYSPFLSNAQRLPNGNTLVNPGSTGVIFEIDEDRNRVWEYVIPLFGDLPGMQGQQISNNATFRAYKYAADYAGFAGIDLTPGETIESGTDTSVCEITTRASFQNADEFRIAVDSKNKHVRIIRAPAALDYVNLYDSSGRNIGCTWNDRTIIFPDWTSGVYFISCKLKNGQTFVHPVIIY